MRDEITPSVMATWATRELPARLDVAQTAKLLGFAAHDIQILMGTGKLMPLGDPAQNAPKWFAAVLILRLAADEEWLHKATKEVAKYWLNKRQRRVIPVRHQCRREVGSRGSVAEKVSPKSSPEPSPKGQLASNEGAMTGGERAVAKVA